MRRTSTDFAGGFLSPAGRTRTAPQPDCLWRSCASVRSPARITGTAGSPPPCRGRGTAGSRRRTRRLHLRGRFGRQGAPAVRSARRAGYGDDPRRLPIAIRPVPRPIRTRRPHRPPHRGWWCSTTTKWPTTGPMSWRFRSRISRDVGPRHRRPTTRTCRCRHRSADGNRHAALPVGARGRLATFHLPRYPPVPHRSTCNDKLPSDCPARLGPRPR